MPSTTQTPTTSTIKQDFTDYIKANIDFDNVFKIYQHAKITCPSYQPDDYITKSTPLEFVTDKIFDLINDYTDINFDTPSTLKDINFDELMDKDYEYGDAETDIYNSSLYQSCDLFSEEIDEALSEYDKPSSLCVLVQMAQNSFYANFYRSSLTMLQDFLQSQNN